MHVTKQGLAEENSTFPILTTIWVAYHYPKENDFALLLLSFVYNTYYYVTM